MYLSRSLCVLLVLAFASACGGGNGNGDVDIASPPGIRGTGALRFDGFGEIASIAQPPPMHFLFNTGFTFEAWIKPKTIPTKLELGRPFFGQGGAQWMYVHAGTLGLVTQGQQVVTNDIIPLKTNEWQHVAATYDGSIYVLYINGVPLAGVGSIGVLTTMNAFHIGALPGAMSTFHGDIDEIRVWNVARSEAEILAHMETPVPPDAPGLRAYFRCEGSGQELTDSSQHGVHAGLGSDPLMPDGDDPERVGPDF